MPDFFEPAADAEHRDVRRTGRSATRGRRRKRSIRAFHLSISVLPAAIVGVFGLAAVAVMYRDEPLTQQARLVIAMAAVGTVITLAAAAAAADAATRRVHRQRVQSAVRDHENMQWRLGELGFLVARGRQDLQRLAERLGAGETAAPCREDHPAPDTRDPVMRLAHELQRAQGAAWNAVLGAAGRERTDRANQRVGVFVNLARRMQTLSHRAIQGLDELENQVEDPDLLKGLFKVDHLTTRTRRQAESLAVIGGAASRRQWTRPVTVYEVLRSAIAEVEHYQRVKVVPPIEGSLHGGAVADVVHLLAELIENATKFSPPQTQVLIRVESVSAGLAIEVEDRGLGVPPDDRRRLNDLLADHERADTEELLEDGRIGLLVVSALARRHKIRVQIQGNVYGGTQAVVVVPKELDGRESESPPAASEQGPDAPPAPAGRTGTRPPTAPPATQSAMPSSSPSSSNGGSHRRPAPARPSGPPEDVAGPGTGPVLPGDAGERPALPQRRAQTHLVPELARAPALQQDDQEAEHNPGLMAAFQKGMRSAMDDDGTADGRDGANPSDRAKRSDSAS